LSVAEETLVVQLLGTDGGRSKEVVIGNQVGIYQVVNIPIAALIGSTEVNINQITGLQFNLNDVFETTGTVFIDAIELVNNVSDASPASAETWSRANSVTRGLNTSNWLEAHWLIPFNAYPETNKYNATNIAALRDAGFDVIRMPVTFERFTSTNPPYTIPINHPAMQLVDDMIGWAEEYDFKLIIDNHHGYDITNENYRTELPRLKAIWEQLASRYGDLDPERYFFEIYNEAHLISNVNLRTFYNEIITTIRENEAQTHSILVGATGYNSGPDLISFTPLVDEDIIYTFHDYSPYFFTHQGMSWTTPSNFAARTFPQGNEIADINRTFADIAAWSTNWDVPVWMGEFGVSSSADATSRCNWIETMESAAQANEIISFYWDAISSNDAFGFFNNGVVSEATTVPCFAQEMELFESILSVQDIDLSVDCNQGNIRLSIPPEPYLDYILQSSLDGVNWQDENEISFVNSNTNYQF
ncbi:MAG: glycoside hydrolase family 5 protein, partial [Saprospiraceae bacterium]